MAQIVGPAAPWKCRTASIPRHTMTSWMADRIRNASHPESRRPRNEALHVSMPGKMRMRSSSREMEAR